MSRPSRTMRHFWACGLLLLGLMPHKAMAQQLILDEEFTQACENLTAPLRATLASGTTVHFVLVADESINAFVDKENIIYVHSGLVLKAKSAAELQGVLAHEMGHITAQHILKGKQDGERLTAGGIAGAMLGLGAAAAGAPQAGMAIALGSQAGALSTMLAHSRTQEAEADQYALKALHTAGLSAKGMVDMFTTLRTESQLSYNSPPPFLVTHPLPPERLSTLQREIDQEKQPQKTALDAVNRMDFKRLQAKVIGLTKPSAEVLRRLNGPSATAHYANALTYAKQGNRTMAEQALKPLLTAHPKDPYYNEVLAQMALNEGDLGTAHNIYKALVNQNPRSVLYRLQFANVLRAQNALQEALPHYKRVTQQWPEWDEPWYGLGFTYGALSQLPESHLALTEANLIEGNRDAAKQSLALAKTYLAKAKTPNDDTRLWAEALTARIEDMKPE